MYATEDIDRFWSRVAISGDDECWNWTAGKNGVGYGVFYCDTGSGRRAMLSHRFSLGVSLKKDLPRELFVLHSCDNPACVNPHHLRLGTQKENMRDAVIRNRMSKPPLNAHYRKANYIKGEDVWNQSLTEPEVREIWRLHLAGQNNTQISAAVGHPVHVIADVCRGRSWRHLDGAPSLKALRAGGVRRDKLTPADIEAIKAMLAAGRMVKDIAAEFGISTAPISNLKNHGTTWVPKA